MNSVQQQLPDNAQYVLDGGALLGRIPWPRGSTYDSVCDMYVKYVIQRYGTVIIVFDGYTDEPTIKDVTHIQRAGSGACITVHFTGDMVIKSNKDEFLRNWANKQQFINILSDKLKSAGCSTDHAKHDADHL